MHSFVLEADETQSAARRSLTDGLKKAIERPGKQDLLDKVGAFAAQLPAGLLPSWFPRTMPSANDVWAFLDAQIPGFSGDTVLQDGLVDFLDRLLNPSFKDYQRTVNAIQNLDKSQNQDLKIVLKAKLAAAKDHYKNTYGDNLEQYLLGILKEQDKQKKRGDLRTFLEGGLNAFNNEQGPQGITLGAAESGQIAGTKNHIQVLINAICS